MIARITIDTGTDDQLSSWGLADILRDLVEQYEGGRAPCDLTPADVRGNVCGKVEILGL